MAQINRAWPLSTTLEIFPMKKTLIALAAVAATGAAMAQSSVTISGVADINLVKATGSSAQLASSGNGTSRIVFAGTEDLGGGLKAGFHFEQGISLSDGSASGDFNRNAFMNLSGGFGDLRLGRSLNPAFYTYASWSLTGAANYSVVGSQFSPAGCAATADGCVLNSARYNDQIMYTSPSFNGLTVQFAHQLKGDSGLTPADGTNDLSVRYAAGPLKVGFNYAKTASSGADKHLGASYNFGAFSLNGAWVDPAGVSKGFVVGGSVPMGAVTLTAEIARDTNAKDTDTLLEAKYSLSKRTFAYAYYQNNGKGKAASSVNTTGVGIRHNF